MRADDRPGRTLNGEFEALIAHLTGELSLLALADDSFRKLLLMSAASYFEAGLSNHVATFALEASNSSSLIAEIIRKKAISRQYHTWFNWDANNANVFYGLFGADFVNFMRARHIAEPWLNDAVSSFLELGRSRNLLVHENFASFSLEKTASEIFALYVSANRFVEAIPGLLRECNELRSEGANPQPPTSAALMANSLQELRLHNFCR